MKTPPSSGELSDVPFVEVLDFYCQSGQTAVVSIRIPRAAGGDTTGAFYVESGALVDARFDGREGAEAVQHALKLHLGKFQVDLGSRSSRRTVHEPWALLAAAADRALPPTLFPVDSGARPTPPTATPRFTPQSTPAVGASPPALPPSHSGVHRAPAKAPGARAATGEGVAAVAAGPAAQHPAGIPFVPPTMSGPRPAHTSGPTTSPFSGPHTPPPRGHPPGVVPAPTVRRQTRANKVLRAVVLLGLAVVLGGGLAAGVGSLLNRSGQSEQPQTLGRPNAAAPAATPGIRGVTDTEVTLGMAAPLTGASKEIGRQMRVGLDVAFARANAAGGVQGRKLKLIALDDGYEPSRTREVMRELVEQKGVFSFVGNVGTPTAAVAVPYALERKMLFFGAFTGASLLRKEPPDRYVFNYRASYGEETAAIVRYLVDIRHIKPEQIAVLAQDDSYGDAGYQGVARVLRQLKRTPSGILKVTYTRNTSDVADAVARVLDRRANVAAVVMVATYRPAARFIEKVREQRPNMVFTNVSFVGSQALAEELVQLGPQYAQGVIITQVVPLPTGQSTVGLKYREALASFAPEEKPDFISLEGYVTGNLLLEGLKLAGRDLTTDGLVDALESIHGLDLGLGVPLSFGLSEHQASHKVWGTVLDASGTFQQLDLE
jgi:branched-chain amino acid transport system substrate-binding protein